LLLCSGCSGPEPGHAFFRDEKPGVQVIAHRGGAGLRPENTLAAFQHAAQLGADVLEMDLRVAADGAIVVMHDATVERTTDGAGAVASLKLAELKRLDAGYRWSPDGGATFPYRGRGVRVPALQIPDRMRDTVLVTPELLARAHGKNMKLHAFTVNDDARLRELARMGVDGVMTDWPDRLLAIRASPP